MPRGSTSTAATESTKVRRARPALAAIWLMASVPVTADPSSTTGTDARTSAIDSGARTIVAAAP